MRIAQAIIALIAINFKVKLGATKAYLVFLIFISLTGAIFKCFDIHVLYYAHGYDEFRRSKSNGFIPIFC